MSIFKSPCLYRSWAFFVLFLFLKPFFLFSQQSSVVLINNSVLTPLQLSVCEDHLNKEFLEECLVTKFAQRYAADCLCEVDARVSRSANFDTLRIDFIEKKYLDYSVQASQDLPLNWLPKPGSDGRKSISALNRMLNRSGFSSVIPRFTRSLADSSSLVLTFKPKQKQLSSIDFTAGFGSSNAFSFYGRGNLDLYGLSSDYSISRLYFERLSTRNSHIRLRHFQLNPFFLLGPNDIAFEAVQRDPIYRLTAASIKRYFYLNSSFYYSIAALYRSGISTLDSDNQQNINANTLNNAGAHRAFGWSFELSNSTFDIESARVEDGFDFLYQLKVDQLFKSFDAESESTTNDLSYSNAQLIRVFTKTQLTVPLTEWSSIIIKTQVDFVPSDLTLSPSEVNTYGGIRSIRGYPEDAYIANRAFIGKTELKRYLDYQSYFMIFFDAAQLQVNQQIDAQSFTEWNNSGETRSFYSSGLGLKNRSNRTETEVIIAFTREFGFFNPRIHLSFKRLF